MPNSLNTKLNTAMDQAKWKIQEPQLDLSYVMKNLPIRSNQRTARKSLPPRLMSLARKSGIKYIILKDHETENEEDQYDQGDFSLSLFYGDDANCSALAELADSTVSYSLQSCSEFEIDNIIPHSGFTVSQVPLAPLLPSNYTQNKSNNNLKNLTFSANQSYTSDEQDSLEWSKRLYFRGLKLNEYVAEFPTGPGIDNALVELIHYEELSISKLDLWIEEGLSHSLASDLAEIMAGEFETPAHPKGAEILLGKANDAPGLKLSRFNKRRYRIDWHAAMSFNQSLTTGNSHDIRNAALNWNRTAKEKKEKWSKTVFLNNHSEVGHSSYGQYIWLMDCHLTVNEQLIPETVTQHFWPLLGFCHTVSNINGNEDREKSFSQLPDNTEPLRALREITKNDNFVVDEKTKSATEYRIHNTSDYDNRLNSGTWWASLFHQISDLRSLEYERVALQESLIALKGELNNGTAEII